MSRTPGPVNGQTGPTETRQSTCEGPQTLLRAVLRARGLLAVRTLKRVGDASLTGTAGRRGTLAMGGPGADRKWIYSARAAASSSSSLGNFPTPARPSLAHSTSTQRTIP